MKPRSLILLALLVAGLAVFIFFYERELPSSDERREQQDLVLDIDVAEIDTVILERPGEPAVELRRGGADEEPSESSETSGDTLEASSSWRLVRPFSFRAAEADIDRLLQSLANLRHERVLESFDPAELELDEPRALVTLKRGERTDILRIGADIPAYSSIAVQRAGGAEAYVVGEALWDEIAKEPGEWRSRQVVPAARTAIRRITWRIDDTRFTLARRDGELRVVAPFEDVADETRVEELLTVLTSLSVDQFLPADDPEIEGDKYTLRLRFAGRRDPFVLVVAESGDDGVLRLSYEGQAATAAAGELVARLAGPAAAWRSRRWSSLDTWEVERLTVRDADGAVALARADAGWTRDGEEIPHIAVTDLLDALLEVEAESIRSRPENWTPQADPVFELELQTEGGTEEVLALYPDAVATTSTRGALFELPADTVDRLGRRLAEVRNAEAVRPTETGGGEGSAEPANEK